MTEKSLIISEPSVTDKNFGLEGSSEDQIHTPVHITKLPCDRESGVGIFFFGTDWLGMTIRQVHVQSDHTLLQNNVATYSLNHTPQDRGTTSRLWTPQLHKYHKSQSTRTPRTHEVPFCTDISEHLGRSNLMFCVLLYPLTLRH